MPDKPFKTYDELITILQERGIDLSSEEDDRFARTVLSKEGYSIRHTL